MNTSSGIWAFAIMATALVFFFGGIRVGEHRKEIELRPVEIANDCAYYDMESGDFTWGHRPIVMGAAARDSDLDSASRWSSVPATRTKHKPQVLTIIHSDRISQ